MSIAPSSSFAFFFRGCILPKWALLVRNLISHSVNVSICADQSSLQEVNSWLVDGRAYAFEDFVLFWDSVTAECEGLVLGVAGATDADMLVLLNTVGTGSNLLDMCGCFSASFVDQVRIKGANCFDIGLLTCPNLEVSSVHEICVLIGGDSQKLGDLIDNDGSNDGREEENDARQQTTGNESARLPSSKKSIEKLFIDALSGEEDIEESVIPCALFVGPFGSGLLSERIANIIEITIIHTILEMCNILMIFGCASNIDMLNEVVGSINDSTLDSTLLFLLSDLLRDHLKAGKGTSLHTCSFEELVKGLLLAHSGDLSSIGTSSTFPDIVKMRYSEMRSLVNDVIPMGNDYPSLFASLALANRFEKQSAGFDRAGRSQVLIPTTSATVNANRSVVLRCPSLEITNRMSAIAPDDAPVVESMQIKADVKSTVLFCFVCLFVQGFDCLRAKVCENNWESKTNWKQFVRILNGPGSTLSCALLEAEMLGTILFPCTFMNPRGDKELVNNANSSVNSATEFRDDFPSIALMRSQHGAVFLGHRHNAARRIATLCIAAGVPCPLLQSCLHFMDSCRWAGILGDGSSSLATGP